MTQIDPDEIVSTEDVARMAGVDTRTVQRWCKTGELKNFRVGRDYIIFKKDADAFLAKRGK